jgi:histidine ammonia-lyase
LGVEDVVALARGDALIDIDPVVSRRLAAARAVVDEAVARGDAVYGLITGFRAIVAFLDEDRPLGAELDALAAAVPGILAAARGSLLRS